MPSDFHDLRFFDVNELVELLDVLVVQLLHVFLGAPLLVLGRVLELLELRDRLGAGMAHGDPAFLRQLVHHLDQIAAPLLGERRQGHADEVALRRRIEAEIRLADGLLDGRGEPLVERLHREQPRLGRRDQADLIERHLAAVGLDPHQVEQRGGRLAAPDGGQLPLGGFDRLVHRFARVLGQLGNGAHRTMVPTRSP